MNLAVGMVKLNPIVKFPSIPGLLGLLLVVAAPAANGFTTNENVSYLSRVWQTEEGLPQNVVQAIAQTSDGYLWLGTPKGLVRFNGFDFKTYNAENTPALRRSAVTVLCKSENGSLWIGTDGGGLSLWQNGKISPVTDATIGQSVRDIAVSGDSVWVGTTNGLHQLHHGKVAASWDIGIVRSLDLDSFGNVFVIGGWGAQFLSKGAFHTSEELRFQSARSICCARNGDIWFGRLDGLTRWRNGQTQTYKSHDGLADERITVIYEDRAGVIWIGTYGGLNRFENGQLTEIKKEGETFDLVHSITEDAEGNLWVGARDGLHRLNQNYFRVYTRRDGLSNNNVMSVCEDHDGNIWVGTWGGGLNLWQKEKFTSDFRALGLTTDLILGIHEDRRGNLWIGTDFDGGLFRRTGTNFFRNWEAEGLTGSVIRTIFEDNKDRRIWVGTSKAVSAVKRGGKFVDYGATNGLPGLPIRVLHEDRQGRIWIGTQNGLGEWRAGQITSFRTTNGLPSNLIYSLADDADGNLWVGTAGGIARYREGKFTAYTAQQGLAAEEIFSIVEDDFNWLWMSSRTGIFRVHKRDFDFLDRGELKALPCFSYGKSDGLSSPECNGSAHPSGLRMRDGSLCFATTRGLVRVDPNIPLNEKAPAIVFEGIFADKRNVLTDAAQLVTIPPGRGELEIHYAALSFQVPEKNRFKYKLQGVDGDWVEAGNRRVAYYNNLPPGSYEFHVIGCNNDGAWNATGARMKLSVQPHFWQTLWFKSAIAATAGLALASIFQLRSARRRDLEKLRMRLATDLHDEIGSSLGSISLLTRKVQKDGPLLDDQKEDVASINRIATQSANSIRDIVWFINPEYDTTQDLLLRMKDVANTMLPGLDVRFTNPNENLAQKLSLDFRRNIFLMFKEILGNIVKHSRATEVEIVISGKNNAWQLDVRDNGIGFDPAVVHRDANGLKNLQRRAEKLKGTLEIKSVPRQGTRVSFSTRPGSF